MVQMSSGSTDYFAIFFQVDIVNTIAASIIASFLMAHLIWLIERTQYGKSALHTNPKEAFSPKYLDGLKDGMWFSSNT